MSLQHYCHTLSALLVCLSKVLHYWMLAHVLEQCSTRLLCISEVPLTSACSHMTTSNRPNIKCAIGVECNSAYCDIMRSAVEQYSDFGDKVLVEVRS